MKRRMAWVTEADTLEIRESGLPELGPKDVLIRTAYSAICGSDMHLYHNRHPFVKAPSTIGHELSGTVAAVGQDVSSVQVGDAVVPEPILVCGGCRQCLQGNYHMCEHVSYGYRKGQAGFGDYYICEERWAHKIPQGVALDSAALTEPLSVAIHAAEKAGDLFGKTVAVVGAGAIGALCAAVCHTKGAGRIFVVDANPFKLELASRGIGEPVCPSATLDPVQVILEKTEGRGAEVVLECTGAETRIKQAFAMTAKLGTLVQVGIPQAPLGDFDYAKIISREITVKGAQGYCFNFDQALSMLASGFDAGRYITVRYPFEKIGEAFALMAQRGVPQMKALITYETEGEDTHD